MPRFRDEWVLDRVLFDYVSGGACSCCGLQHFLPNGVADLIGAVSDLDTDQQKQELAALSFHPWPPELREQVWADRVRLRQKLKLDKKKYQSIWQDETLRNKFLDWCKHPNTIANYRRWFQLSRTEIMEMIQQRYNIHSAYGVVLCAVMEQVAAFHLTEYPRDGRGCYELDFEALLTYDRRGGFTLPLLKESRNNCVPGNIEHDNNDSNLDEKGLDIWLKQLEYGIGSPGKQLLVRKASRTTGSIPSDGITDNSHIPMNSTNDETNESVNENGNGNNDQQEEGDPDISNQAVSTSFASDRRIIRLLIARIWAELLESKFRKEQEEEELEGAS